jgi:hypothetical protein
VKPERGLYMVNSKRPKLLSEDQLEGYIAYYGHPISLDNIKLRISSATVFDSPDNIPFDGVAINTSIQKRRDK